MLNFDKVQSVIWHSSDLTKEFSTKERVLFVTVVMLISPIVVPGLTLYYFVEAYVLLVLCCVNILQDRAIPTKEEQKNERVL